MFNKPKRNFCSRKRDSESDEEIVSDDAQPKNVTKTAGNSAAKTGQSLTNTAADKGKKKPNELKPVSSANSLLSFVSNEEGMLKNRCIYFITYEIDPRTFAVWNIRSTGK